jgi:hypothetical protein
MRFRLRRRRVIITKKSDGRSVMGVLWSRWLGVWVLKQAQVENDQGQLVPADGEVVVLRENIDFVQVLP